MSETGLSVWSSYGFEASWLLGSQLFLEKTLAWRVDGEL
jgi:hypothetical protein